MKQLFRGLGLSVMLMLLLCVGALAADPATAGMYNITGDGASLTPQTAAGTGSITATTETVGSATYTNGYYADAARFGVSATGTAGSQYLLLVTKGAVGTAPTANNIVYLDQTAAGTDGKVTFNAYPSSLSKGHYCVYIVGTDKAFSANSPAAQFDTYQPYTLGDVDADGNIGASDALSVLRSVARMVELNSVQQLAADVDMDGNVGASDALQILRYVARLINHF